MLVIVRHGNTFAAGEPPRRIGAATDLPLTDTGHAQAAALGAHFVAKGWQFARAFVSPLLRTRQTADAILARQGFPVRTEDAPFLREIDHGPDENRTEGEVIDRIGLSAIETWDAEAVPPPGWVVGAEERLAAWQALLGDVTPGDAPTLLVTSNGAARFALLAAGLRPSSLKLATGSYGVIERASDGALRVPAWGLRP